MQAIFERYLTTRSVCEFRDALNRDSIRSKAWISQTGRAHGGCAITHGALYHILSNRVYVGEIVHRERTHQGLHAPLLSAELFDAVQKKLKLGALPLPEIKSVGRLPLLLGKLFDDGGAPMTSAHSNKGERRYFYYVSTALTQRKRTGSLARVSAPRLERLVTELITPLLDPHWVISSDAPAIDAVRRIVLSKDKIALDLAAECLSPSQIEDQGGELDEIVRIERSHDLAPMRGGRRLLSSMSAQPRIDSALVRAIAQARRWHGELISGEATSIQDIAVRENACPIYTGQLLPLAFLAPDLVEAILDGRQPARLSLVGLIKATLPLRLSEQRALFAQFA